MEPMPPLILLYGGINKKVEGKPSRKLLKKT